MKHPHDMTIDELVRLRVVDDGRQILEEMPCLAGDLCRGSGFEDAEGEAWGTFLLRSGWVRYPAEMSVLGR